MLGYKGFNKCDKMSGKSHVDAFQIPFSSQVLESKEKLITVGCPIPCAEVTVNTKRNISVTNN